LVQTVAELPAHEFMQMGFDQAGFWLGLVHVRPHKDRPEDVPHVPIHMFLSGLKGRYATEEETRAAAHSMIQHAIKHFSPHMP
jgi:hypothetical protein